MSQPLPGEKDQNPWAAIRTAFQLDDTDSKQSPVIAKEKAAERPNPPRPSNTDHRLANIGWLFYKDYYRGISDSLWKHVGIKLDERDPNKKALTSHFDNKNKTIFKQRFTQEGLGRINDKDLVIPLTTTYPGLLLGTGYSHETGTDGEFKLGFYFDWTTGMPVIPGSSVKGVLRSAFAKPLFLTELLKYKNIEGLTHDLLKSWEIDIFGSENGDDEGIKGKDIFFDAVIIDAPDPFLATDFITPHINRKNPKMSSFSNPNPLQFLKILPGVTFEFRFRLTDSKELEAKDKKQVFENILTILGVGAKTNVGYGHLIPTDTTTDK